MGNSTATVVRTPGGRAIRDRFEDFDVMGNDPTDPETPCSWMGCGRTDTPYLGIWDMPAGEAPDGTFHEAILVSAALCPKHVDEYRTEEAWQEGCVPLVLPIGD